MTKIERFENLAAFKSEKLRLQAVRDHHAAQLMAHVDALKEGEVRSTLMKNTLRSLIGGSVLGKLLSTMIGAGGLGGGIGMAMGVGKGGFLKRLGLFALGMAAPKLLKKLEALSLTDIGHELSVSWHRVKDHLDQRKANKV